MKTKPSIILAALFVAGLVLGATVDAFGQREMEIIKHFSQSRGPWLGVYLQDVTSKLAKKENLKAEEGAYVTKVLERSPADSAGIQKGDTLKIRIGDREVVAPFLKTYGDVPEGKPVCMVSSGEVFEVAINQGDLGKSIGARRGDPVTVQKQIGGR